MAELEAPAVSVAAEEGALVEEPGVESWIALTQNGLGRLVEKPRLMADRLRKPPFRFLFDVIVEVARQTGFGLSELFSGSLSVKPQAPNSRDEKIAFLEQWVHLVQWALGPPISGDLMAVSPANIVCGVKPEWTNFLLQCTAAAAWPSQCSVVRTSSPAPPIPTVPLQVSHPATALPEEPPQQPDNSIGQTSETQPPLSAPVVEQAPLVIEPEITVEQAREIAAGMDFRTTLNAFHTAQQEIATTTGELPMPLSQPGVEVSQDPSQDPQESDQQPVEGESVARAPLKQAAARTAYINEEVRKAEEMLNQIEEGYDRREEEYKSKKAQLEEKIRLQREEAEAREREAIEAEEAAAREAQRLKDEKAERKAARKAEKERLAAEEERLAAEEAARPVYPVSKHTAEHGARIVACVGDDDEYAWDGDEDDQAKQENGTEQVQEMQVPLEGAAAFDLSSALNADSNLPTDAFGGQQFAPGASSSLFEKLKVQLKETFVSYLCASMPATLLKQYKPGELVACLQFLLAELRRSITQHCFEDVGEEEPTSIAEEIRAKFPDDWLTYLQEGTPSVFCQQYDVPELIDTLQSLSQICLERLEDNLGPLQSWLEESSPLRYIPPVEPMVVEVETPKGEREDGFAVASTSGGFGFTSELGPAPWEEPAPVVASQVPSYGGGFAATSSDFRHRVPSPTPVISHPPAVFDATLGPAIWEQPTVSYPSTSTGNQPPRYATTALGGRAIHTAMPHPGNPPHPASSNGRSRPMTHVGGHTIASR